VLGRALLGHTQGRERAREGEHERVAGPRVAGPSPRGRKGRPELQFCFFFFNNMNSNDFCLFH
jgi:hypothetical protein